MVVFSCGLKLVIDYVVDKCNLQRAHPFRFPPQTCRGSDWAFEHSGLSFDQRLGFCLRSQHGASVFVRVLVLEWFMRFLDYRQETD